jgi:hypothetical protein
MSARKRTEGRKLSAEETANFDKAIADADAIGVEIEREQKLMALEKRAIENVAEAERARQPAGSDSPEVRKRVALQKWIAALRHRPRRERVRGLPPMQGKSARRLPTPLF